MTTVRTAKNKGSSFEYSCLESIQQKFPEAYLTKQRGFQLQFDIQEDVTGLAVECKRLKGISWNQLQKIWDKLVSVKPDKYIPILCFQSNHQPCLVFDGEAHTIRLFDDYFNVPFKKHTPIRKVKKDEES
jgi:hypothetical protein